MEYSKLIEQCDTCKGKGIAFIYGEEEEATCDDCDGMGFFPTPFGKELILLYENFMKTN